MSETMDLAWEANELPGYSLCATAHQGFLQTMYYRFEFSDMTITCRGQEFKAHRAIVCPQSRFFRAALASNFRVSVVLNALKIPAWALANTRKEGMSQTIELPEDEPDILERFLEFMYTGSYSLGKDINWGGTPEGHESISSEIERRLRKPPMSRSDNPESYAVYRPQKSGRKRTSSGLIQPSKIRWTPYTFKGVAAPKKDEEAKESRRHQMTISMKLYFMADKYDVPVLKLLARDRFFQTAESYWVAKTWPAEVFKDTAFFETVDDEVYRSTPTGDTALRQAVCKLVANKVQNDAMKQRMRDVMMDNGELAMGVMDYLRQSGQWVQ
ncbi:BTB POZ domain-containing [Fusarium albosuccineum]|uniref:BTB POZ domain-containing n=1 Tax=Fusarium albosuccineum TaxID=1237068 RepID=A0A8H4PFT3_9HYPO|nr:BTB POZ domain-containing [Fusarium albosuccineum]